MRSTAWALTDDEQAVADAKAAQIARTYGVVVLKAGFVKLYKQTFATGEVYWTVRYGYSDGVGGDDDGQGVLVGDVDEADVPTTKEALVELYRRMDAKNRASEAKRIADEDARLIPIRDGSNFIFGRSRLSMTKPRPIAGKVHSLNIFSLADGYVTADIVVHEDEISSGLTARELSKRFKAARKAMRGG